MKKIIIMISLVVVSLTSCITPSFLTIEDDHIYANMREWDFVTYFENTEIKFQNEFDDQYGRLQAKFEVIDTANNLMMYVDLNRSDRLTETTCLKGRLPSLGFSPMEMDKIDIKKTGNMQYFERLVEFDAKTKVDRMTYYAFLYEKDYCMMIRIIKKQFKEKDRAMMDKILKSIAIKDQ